MDSLGNTYYQDELRYLRDVGPEFARANPEVARFLADRGSDPDVERLLEGVAFLCGRIRQKLDDELPELTANLMGLLWPHYLRPIPSMTTLELLPDIDAMQAPLTVETGTEFASVPIEGTRCRYRSCWPVTLRPWRLESVQLQTEAGKPLRLAMRLRSSEKVPLEDLQLDSVRFHLSGDPRTTFTLYLLLCAHVEKVTVSEPASTQSQREVTLPPGSISTAGLDTDEGVLPYPVRSFVGYRLLQEYFAFKERFLFVDLANLGDAVRELEADNAIEVAVTFNRRLESPPLVATDNLRLHCVPIINLFAHSADPIRAEHDRTQYRVQPAKTGVADRRHLEVYSVDEVAGLSRAGGMTTREYEPFYSFQHAAAPDPREVRCYQTQITPNIIDGDPRRGTDTIISFVVGAAAGELPPEETVSLELTCTNRDLPRAIRAGDISEVTDSSPPSTQFRNLLSPTPTIAPPVGKALHWRLISHMTLNYVSLTELQHLKELIRVYDFRAEHDAQVGLAHQRMLDGILSIETRFDERLIRGAAVRGSQIDLALDEDHFAGEGDAYLFSAILDRFFGLYATINAYTQLTVRFSRSGQTYSFPARWGEQLTPASTKASA